MTALLLGNGFSRAFDDRFRYDALYDVAGFTGRVVEAFNQLGTRDFEVVLQRLDQFLQLAPVYGIDNRIIASVTEDRTRVQTSLIHAVQAHHPEHGDMSDAERLACSTFLRKFNRIFTVSYDLLIYWVIVAYLTDGTLNDGFRGYADLTWQDQAGQNVFYLHGGLHLWEDGGTLHKLRYSSGQPLGAQIQAALDRGQYPLFVAEGTSQQKKARIASSPYLSGAIAALERNAENLLIYGMGLWDADQHIIDAIASSKTPALAVTYHDTARPDEIDRLRGVALNIAARLKTNNGADVPVHLVPASEVFSWH